MLGEGWAEWVSSDDWGGSVPLMDAKSMVVALLCRMQIQVTLRQGIAPSPSEKK